MLNFPFQNWFTGNLIVGGDWRFFWPENLREIFSYSYAWDSSLNTGIGRTNVIPWLNTYLAYLGHFYTQALHIPWNIAEKLLFFWPIILLSFLSAFYLSKLLVSGKYFRVLAGFLYCLNTYALMIFSGGQVGVALAYSIAPLVLAKFIQLTDSLRSQNQTISRSITAGLILAVQVMFEQRLAYITLMAIVVYFAIRSFFIIKVKKIVKDSLFVFVIPGIVAILLHAFWILPFLIYRQNFIEQLGIAYGSKGMVEFLSFADFSHALSLLHPNWPENIFGKTYFMKPEFLILPILAYLSLIFLQNRHSGEERSDDSRINDGFWTGQNDGKTVNKKIVYFGLLGLLGAFLAKGSNPPFGEVYLWLFNYFPGMSMFRDPTKFYMLVALSYSVLIPFSISKIIYRGGFQEKARNFSYFPGLFLLFIIGYLLFLIKPAILGELGGTFKPKQIPQEYADLKNFLSRQPEFFRTFWISQKQRFGFFSNHHPSIDSLDLLKAASSSAVVYWLHAGDAREQLSFWSVKYLIVPYDSESEIFLEDRKYSPGQRQRIEYELDKIPWLKKINTWEKIAVYELPEYKDHFWIREPQGLTLGVNYQMVNPTKYIIRVKNVQAPFTLIFSEGYNHLWQAEVGKEIIPSKPYRQIINSFPINKTGDLEIIIEFTPQKYVVYGLTISALTLIISLSLIGYCIFPKNS